MMKCDHMDHMVLSQNNVIILNLKMTLLRYTPSSDTPTSHYIYIYIYIYTLIYIYIYCLRTPHHPPPDRGHGVMESNEDSESLISQALRGVENS